MNEYELSLLQDIQANLDENDGDLDEAGMALMRAIGRGSEALQDAFTEMMDQRIGFAAGRGELVH